MDGAAPSLQDAQLLITNDKALIPQSWGQACMCLTILQALINASLGDQHGWTLALGTFLEELMAQEMELEIIHPHDPQYWGLVPAMIVCWVQLHWSVWVQQQWYQNADVPIPNLLDLFIQIQLEATWELMLPTQYLHLTERPLALASQCSFSAACSSSTSCCPSTSKS